VWWQILWVCHRGTFGRLKLSDPPEKLEEPDISGSSIPFLEII
jgi:hypothetical protein